MNSGPDLLTLAMICIEHVHLVVLSMFLIPNSRMVVQCQNGIHMLIVECLSDSLHNIHLKCLLFSTFWLKKLHLNSTLFLMRNFKLFPHFHWDNHCTINGNTFCSFFWEKFNNNEVFVQALSHGLDLAISDPNRATLFLTQADIDQVVHKLRSLGTQLHGNINYQNICQNWRTPFFWHNKGL